MDVDEIAMQELVRAAKRAAENAYAPYSRFRVGAALLLADGVTVTGCNVENASYGLSSCAERNAVFRAVSERGPGVRVAAVAVANLNGSPSPPCGACRQVLSEFAASGAVVVFAGEGGFPGEPVRLADLLPYSFSLGPSLGEASR